MAETAEMIYGSDFFAWTQDQVAHLRRAAAAGVVIAPGVDLDFDHLAEEIDSMGRSERNEISSRLSELLFHLAKLAWSAAVLPRGDWMVSVLNQRDGIADILSRSPSLKTVPQEILGLCWTRARKRTAAALDLPLASLPRLCPWDLATQVLEDNWLPPAHKPHQTPETTLPC